MNFKRSQVTSITFLRTIVRFLREMKQCWAQLPLVNPINVLRLEKNPKFLLYLQQSTEILYGSMSMNAWAGNHYSVILRVSSSIIMKNHLCNAFYINRPPLHKNKEKKSKHMHYDAERWSVPNPDGVRKKSKEIY